MDEVRPGLSTVRTASARRLKSAESREGAIKIISAAHFKMDFVSLEISEPRPGLFQDDAGPSRIPGVIDHVFEEFLGPEPTETDSACER